MRCEILRLLNALPAFDESFPDGFNVVSIYPTELIFPAERCDSSLQTLLECLAWIGNFGILDLLLLLIEVFVPIGSLDLLHNYAYNFHT